MEITEDYVSFGVAKLLEEKGFDKSYCTGYAKKSNSNGTCELIRVCTLQMACKWLREEHNLFIFPFPQMNTNKFWTEIYQLSNNQEWENLYCESIDLQDYSTYEEAVEAAIKFTLENLI